MTGGLRGEAAAAAAERDMTTDENRHSAADGRHRNEGEPDARYRAWVQEDAARLKDSPLYAELMGTPTWRERLVALAGRCRASAGFGGGAGAGGDPRARSGAFEALLRPVPARLLPALAVLAGVGLASFWAVRMTEPDYATGIAETRHIALNDGSRVDLGGKSALDVDFSTGERTVRLAEGEAYFSVAHDTARPFVVLAGDRRIRVVGTKFDVKYSGDQVRVAVAQGIVEVMPAAASAVGRVRLTAGQQLVADGAGGAERAAALYDHPAGGWRTGRLSYQDATLAEIVADANRYRARPIRILSPGLAQVRLTTSFPATQADAMLDTLRDALSVQVDHRPDGTVALRAAP